MDRNKFLVDLHLTVGSQSSPSRTQKKSKIHRKVTIQTTRRQVSYRETGAHFCSI